MDYLQSLNLLLNMKITFVMDKIEKVLVYFLSATFAIMAASLFYQIIMRYIFKNANVWTEELTRYLFIWLTMIGSAVAYRNGRHMDVDYFVGLMSKKIKSINFVVCNALLLSFLGTVFYQGIKLVGVTHKQLSSGMRIPMSYIYLAIPVGCFLTLLFAFESYALIITKKRGG